MSDTMPDPDQPSPAGLTDDQHAWASSFCGIDTRAASADDANGAPADPAGTDPTTAVETITDGGAGADPNSGDGPGVELTAGGGGTRKPKFDGVTTYSMTSKLMLAKAGYRFTRTDGGFDVWTKVDGSSFIWVQLPKTGPSDPGGPGTNPPPPPNPGLRESSDAAADFESRFSQLFQEAIKLKGMKDANGSYPAGPFNDYFKRLSQYDEDLKSVLDNDADVWLNSTVTDDERNAIQAAIDRIKKVQEHEPEMDLE